MNPDFKKLFCSFFKEFKEDEVYNEFSLQHELGIYLRENLQKHGNFKVQFEKNSLDVLGYEEPYPQKELEKRFGNKKFEKKKLILLFEQYS